MALIALLTFISIPSINAQWKVGVLGGLNFSNWRAETEMESRTLFGIGGIIEYSINDNFSISVEPMYSQKGAVKLKTLTEPEMTTTTSYAELPIFIKYSIPLSSSIKPYLIAGPTLSYRLKAETEGKYAGLIFTADLKNVTVPFDFSFGVSAGFEIPLESISLFLEGRYTYGLVDQHKNGTFQASSGGLTLTGTMTDSQWFKNSGIQLLTGIKFIL